ncbi:MAG: lectin like domain-containing protein, partial [Campylobacterota bacterium]|nr:lectin like domain-containing protein [Campylobacterota bacterium]
SSFSSGDTVTKDANDAALNKSHEESLNPDFTQWQESGENEEYNPSPLKFETLNDTSSGVFTRNTRASFPQKFSLHDINLDGNRDDSFITSVKDQGACGSCWTFAGYGALEGSYGHQSTMDLSEDNLKHLHGYVGNDACGGGNMPMILGYLSNFRGALTEAQDPYSGSRYSEYCSTCTPEHYIDNAIMVPTRRNTSDNDTIKSILFEKKKPMYVSIEVGYGTAGESGGGTYEASTYSFFQGSTNNRANHAVVLVGWDDNYRAQGQVGAFIIKNSWGMSAGDRGYYYIPYADLTVGFGELVYFEDEEESSLSFDSIYSHDELGAISALGLGSSSIETANVFKAKKDESIVAASFFVSTSGVKAEVEFHQVTSQNPLVTQKVGNTQYIKNDIIRGFYTAKFPQAIEVTEDSLFAIVVRYTAPSGSVRFPVELSYSGYSSTSAQAGESFYRSSGEWSDVTEYRSDVNIPIKALAYTPTQAPQSTLHVTASPTLVVLRDNISFSAAFNDSTTIVDINWVFDDGSTSNLISPTHNYSNTGTYDVHATVIGSDGTSYRESIQIRVVTEITSTLSSADMNVSENAQDATYIGTIPINYSGQITISLSGTGSELFRVDEEGKVFTADNSSFDYETTPNYELLATAINGPGDNDPVALNIEVININENLPVLTGFSTSIDENSAAGTEVGRVVIVSSGDSEISAMELNTTSDFDISLSGIVSVSQTANLDYESNAQYNFNAYAINSAGRSEAAPISISLNNVGEVLAVLSDFNATISESLAAGSEVGTITINSIGDSNITSIALTGTGHEDFFVNTQGLIKVSAYASLDYEHQATYDLSAYATNEAGSSVPVDVDITLENAGETVPILAPFSTSIANNSEANTTVGTLEINSTGDTPISSIVLSGVGASDFLVDTDGLITVSQTANIDAYVQRIYALHAVATNGAGDSNSTQVDITVRVSDPQPLVIAKIKANDPTDNAHFSQAIALLGDKILTGAPDADDKGSAYLHVKRENGSYAQLVKIIPNDLETNDKFATSVSMNEDLILVGAPQEDANGTDAGAAYLFRYNPTDKSITQLLKVTGDDTVAGDHFGSSVFLNADYALIGATEHNETGAVYIFKYNASADTLTQQSVFVGAQVANGDGFGYDIVMENNNILVGTATGEAGYLFSYNPINSVLTEIQRFISDDGITPNDLFASRIAMQGNSLLFGSPGSDSAYLYHTNGSLISKITSSIIIDDLNFGSDVAMNTQNILIGSSNDDKVYLYEYNSLEFLLTQPATIFVVNDAGAGSEVGSQVALEGDFIGISAPKEDFLGENSGALFILNKAAENRPYLINYVESLHVNENTTTLFSALSDSVNGKPISYELSGDDASNFTISSSGLLDAISLDYEAPVDENSDNNYSISIDLSDVLGIQYSYPMTIEVLDITD